MRSVDTKPVDPKLSICITTFNRGAFIGATLESILDQATQECEVVVLDGASTDETERVVGDCARRFGRVRYFKQETNNGFDRDCDRMVELARGEYCWLMSDDDLLKPGAVATVLAALQRDLSFIILNVEAKDFAMTKLVQERWIKIESDRVYGPDEMDQLFLDVGEVLRYFGNMVIKRSIWLERDRQRHYDSAFNYLGVIFQKRLPGATLVIAEPLISYRLGNSHSFRPKVLDILWVKWPTLVWSMDLSESAMRKIVSETPWRQFREVMLWRGLGYYTRAEYRQVIRPRVRSIRDKWMPMLVAFTPGVVINTLLVLYYSLGFRPQEGMWQSSVVLQGLRKSPFHIRNVGVTKRRG